MGDVGIRGDRIAAIGDLSGASAAQRIDARGMAVAPGFINMLSWSTESLIEDGLSQSDIRQGVTLEVMGEGWSMGPINEAMRAEMIRQQSYIRFDPTWTTLGRVSRSPGRARHFHQRRELCRRDDRAHS